MASLDEISSAQLQRYSRQIMLPQIGIEGQLRLLRAHVFIIGVGGLGSAAAYYLTASGIGKLSICDADQVEASNLQRQILHDSDDIGRLKTESARNALHRLNPDIQIHTINRRFETLEPQQLETVDILLDASDNFATRFAANHTSIRLGIPLVSAAAIRMEGQLSTFEPKHADSPCYQCLYRDEAMDTPDNCSVGGVLAPIVGIIGTLQALEAIKLITGTGEPLRGRLLLFDGAGLQWRSVRLPRDPLCPACGQRQR